MANCLTYSSLKDELCYTWLRPALSDLHLALENLAESHHQVSVIPARQIYNCLSLSDAFDLLEKWRLLSKDRLSIVVELSYLLGGPTEMIKSRIEIVNTNYMKLSPCLCQRSIKGISQPNCNTSFLHTPSRYEEVYEYLGENLGDRWIDLCRKLPGMRGRAEEIKMDLSVSRQRDKIMLILEEFEARCPGNTLQIVLSTLKRCDLNKQHDYIRHMYSNLL